MSPTMIELLALYAIDTELVGIKKRLEAGPEEIREFERQAETAREERKGIEAEIREKMADVDQCNLDIRSAEAEVEEQEKRLYIIKNNKEYKIVTERVKELKQAVNDLENKALAVMEQLDALRAGLKGKQDEVAAAEAKIETTRAEVEKEAAEIRQRVDALKQERAKQISRVDAANVDAMPVYSQALRRGYGDAMAEMRDGVCQTCFRQQTSNVATLVLVGREIKKFLCAGCGRVLYIKDVN